MRERTSTSLCSSFQFSPRSESFHIYQKFFITEIHQNKKTIFTHDNLSLTAAHTRFSILELEKKENEIADVAVLQPCFADILFAKVLSKQVCVPTHVPNECGISIRSETHIIY